MSYTLTEKAIERKVDWIHKLQSGTVEVFPCNNPQREAYFLRQALRALPKHLEAFGHLASALRFGYKIGVGPRSVVCTPRHTADSPAEELSEQWDTVGVLPVLNIVRGNPHVAVYEFPEFQPTEKELAQLQRWAEKYDYDVSDDSGCLRVTRK